MSMTSNPHTTSNAFNAQFLTSRARYPQRDPPTSCRRRAGSAASSGWATEIGSFDNRAPAHSWQPQAA
eukprot:1862008-Prymnesium_polylepis.1